MIKAVIKYFKKYPYAFVMLMMMFSWMVIDSIQAGKSSEIDPLLPVEADPSSPEQSDPRPPFQIDPLKVVQSLSCFCR